MNRNWCLDYVKSVAIIAVLLYHIGLLKNGYLGVECFFVVSGYLFAKSNFDKFQNNTFHPIRFLLKKLSSFFPLILAASLLSLVVGFFAFLPDDFENLSESVIASSLFSNNVLQCITTKNYWDIVNTYKPLMHTWYIAVLFQSFIFLSLLIWAANKILKRNVSGWIFRIIFLVSLLLYLLPFFSDAYKFYLFPFRLFEICLGACLAYLPFSPDKNRARFFGNIGFTLLAILLFSDWDIPGIFGVLASVLITALIVFFHSSLEDNYGLSIIENRYFTFLGRYSYDIYIWHQVVIAILYYAFFQNLSFLLILFVFLGTALLSTLSVIIRKRFVQNIFPWKRVVACCLIAVPICAVSFYLYSRGGVVRNIPELEIDTKNIQHSKHAAYVDVPYTWDHEFCDPDKIHIFVLGDSYGRDFANVLNESDFSSSIEISYSFGSDFAGNADRVEAADYIFYCTSLWYVPDSVDEVPKDKLYIVGSKKYGNSNGIIYANRNKDWYFDQKVQLDEEEIENNNILKGRFGDHYIDMLTPIMDGNRISVFTDDHYFISQDCRHLTRKGAQYYARILDLDFIC